MRDCGLGGPPGGPPGGPEEEVLVGGPPGGHWSEPAGAWGGLVLQAVRETGHDGLCAETLKKIMFES